MQIVYTGGKQRFVPGAVSSTCIKFIGDMLNVDRIQLVNR